MTIAGTVKEIQAQIDWLASQPHREKIIIAGNHDNYFDPKSRKADDKVSNTQQMGRRGKIEFLEKRMS